MIHQPADSAPDDTRAGGETRSTLTYSPTATPGIVIDGRYKLLEPIGAGGMGEVWLADQTAPVKRRVALKLIHAERSGSAAIIARFEAERQAIALMDHPHIAKLLDAGTTNAGAPFFVMELVKGAPLNTYCDEKKLSIPARLALLRSVCGAVQHAHQKGIIHRDLKPSNILVEAPGGEASPKVIDFGLAKATSGMQLCEHTLFTGIGAVAGTPLYMAPEQAQSPALDVDTRADVYALGVILYELLTGTTPILRESFSQATLEDQLRIIRECDPPTPSARLSDARSVPAEKQSDEQRKWRRAVRGDLDWIVMKALAKERERRYDSASALAQDIDRYLRHEPVLAGPPSLRYRCGKFVRRYRTQVVAAGLVLLALVAGIVGTSLALVRALQAERKALVEQQKAEVAEEEALAAYRETFSSAMENLIGAQAELGPQQRAYLNSGLERWQDFASRQGSDERSRAIRAEGHANIGFIWQALSEREQARAALQTAGAEWQSLVRDFPDNPRYRRELARCRNNLGNELKLLGEHAAAEQEYRAAIMLLKELTGRWPDEPEYRGDLARSHDNLAGLCAKLSRHEEALAEFQRSRDILVPLAKQHPDHPEFARALAISENNQANLLDDLERHDEAAEAYTRAIEAQADLARRFPGDPAHRDVLAGMRSNFAVVLTHQRRLKDAEREYQAALDLQRALVSDFPAMVDYQQGQARTHNNLANNYARRGMAEPAEREFKASIAIRRRLAELAPHIPAYDHELSRTQSTLGQFYYAQQNFEAARTEIREALDRRAKLAARFPQVPDYQLDYAGSCLTLGNLYLAEANQRDSLAWFDKAIVAAEPIHSFTPTITSRNVLRNAYWDRARAHEGLDKSEAAERDWQRALALTTSAERIEYLTLRATHRARAGRFAAAIAEVEELLAEKKEWTAGELYNFACVYAIASSAATPEQEAHALRAIDLLRRALAADKQHALPDPTQDNDLKPLWEREDFKALLKTPG